MGFDLNDFMNKVDGEDFEERPVDIETFVQSEDYLGLPPLSEYQYTLIKASTQIYKRETLHNLYGLVEGEKRWKQTKNEIIFQLGKGSGKDYSSTISCAYVVYLLLCLRDPAKYYGKPPGDTIDILNIAINSTQANNVFFKGFINRIEHSPWFDGRYEKKQGQFEFDKNVNVYSGHSEREAWEGYNVIYVVLDEISGFAINSNSGNENAKTAESVYKMYRGSVSSRFPDYGKLVLLSFPRFKGDFIQQRYDAVIAEKETIVKTHTFKLDPDLPDGTDGNEFDIEWEEDHIVRYHSPRVYALKRCTWDVNPTKTIDDFTQEFFDDPLDALSRFACMPPMAIDAFFKDKEKIEFAFSEPDRILPDGRFDEALKPDPEKRYFIHVDLARKHDHCAVALAHVKGWEQRKIGFITSEPAPVIVVDAVRYWTPKPGKNVDFIEVRNYITSLRERGFNVKLTTFDQWESTDMREYLDNIGMRTDKLSVAKKHYDDFAMVVAEQRLIGPNIDLLKTELLQLRIMNNNKVDHPRKGSKDLSDAVCGAIYNAVAHTPREDNVTIEIETYSTLHRKVVENVLEPDDNVIRAPKLNAEAMPPDISDWISGLRIVGDNESKTSGSPTKWENSE